MGDLYRSRSFNTIVYLAKSEEDGATPILDERGQRVKDYNGCRFLKVSGNDTQRNVRVLPKDPVEFFSILGAQSAAAEGLDWSALSADAAENKQAQKDIIATVLNEYGEMFSKGDKSKVCTYMPVLEGDAVNEFGTNHDYREFVIVVPKQLVIPGSSGSAGKQSKVPLRLPSAVTGSTGTKSNVFELIRKRNADKVKPPVAPPVTPPTGDAPQS